MVPNVFEPEWDAEADRPPYRWRRSRVGRQAGSEQLGASLFEIQPGASTFPLHVHYANEELILVLSGAVSLTTLEGDRRLERGDVVACRAGRDGAHRLDNCGDELARVLIISTMRAPEVNEFPESGVVWARTYAPGAEPAGPEVAGEPRGFDPLALA